MRNRLNFKIVGSGPTETLLAIALSKLDLNIYLVDLLNREKLIAQDKTYAITQSTRKILVKFEIWDNLKPYLFGFDKLSISDSVTLKYTFLTLNDLDENSRKFNNIGWVIKHSDLMNILFEEIDKNKNIFFNSTQELKEEKNFFDYKFISTRDKPTQKTIFKFLDIRKTFNQSCLRFKVLIRGNIEQGAYWIFRNEGPLVILPLDNNLYQIIWTSNLAKTLDRLNSDKNFLMDNLSTILPENFKVDQIVGEVNAFPIAQTLQFPGINFNKLIFVGDSYYAFHPLGGQDSNPCWRDVNSIFDILNKYSDLNKNNLKLFKFQYYFSRAFDIFITVVFSDLLITLFANKNPLLFPIKVISFILLDKFLFIRKMVLSQLTKSIFFSNIK